MVCGRVADLTAPLELRQPSVSHHMKVMTEAGILHREPLGREAWYSIQSERLTAIADLFYGVVSSGANIQH